MTLTVLEAMFTANSKRDQEKLPYLHAIDVKLKIIQTVIRLAHDVKALDDKKYRTLSISLEELGKMLGGWIKSLQ